MDKTIKNVIYFWWDHLLIGDYPKLMNLIESCIKEHDYYTFKLLQQILNNFTVSEVYDEFMEFLPDKVTVEYEDGDIERVILTEELFNKIDHSEYECG